MTVLIVVLAILALLAFFLVSQYNRLVALRNRFRNAFAQIDVQLKRRHDLIPNLVEIAKAYMSHERETLEAVIQARNQAGAAERQAAAAPGDPSAMAALAGAERALTGSLGRFFALAEAYPQLRANENMMALQEELSSTENRIAFARQGYNDAVMQYNTARESFPTNVVAGSFGFQDAALLALDSDEERAVPRLGF